MKGTLVFAVYLFGEVIEWSMIARAIMSWFVRNPNSVGGKIYGLTITLTEPIVGPIRDFLTKRGANNGGIDWSLLIAFLLWQIIIQLIIKAIYFI